MQNTIENSVLNCSELLARFDNDEEFLEELLETFVEEVKVKLFQIKIDIVQRNYDNIRFVAHSLRGITSSLTAFTMLEAVREMENAILRNDLKMVTSYINIIEREHNKIIRYLNN